MKDICSKAWEDFLIFIRVVKILFLHPLPFFVKLNLNLRCRWILYLIIFLFLSAFLQRNYQGGGENIPKYELVILTRLILVYGNLIFLISLIS